MRRGHVVCIDGLSSLSRLGQAEHLGIATIRLLYSTVYSIWQDSLSRVTWQVVGLLGYGSNVYVRVAADLQRGRRNLHSSFLQLTDVIVEPIKPDLKPLGDW